MSVTLSLLDPPTMASSTGKPLPPRRTRSGTPLPTHQPFNSPPTPMPPLKLHRHDEPVDDKSFTEGDFVLVSSDNVRFRIPSFYLFAAR